MVYNDCILICDQLLIRIINLYGGGFSMGMSKQERHLFLMSLLNENPFLKDEELAAECGVSVSTIRNDRAEMGISEYRERVKSAAEGELHGSEKKEELLDLTLYENGISILETDSTMSFHNTDIVKSQCIYAFAENLALSVINADAALVKVANVKYVSVVRAGEKLVAKSRVIRNHDGEFIVHVFITVEMKEVFRGKFSLEVIEGKL